MHLPFRVTRDNALDLDINNLTKSGEVLVHSREDIIRMIEDMEAKLQRKLSKHNRALLLNLRAIDYQTLGDPRMLETAQESYAFSKTAITTFVLALAYHFHGQMEKAFDLYEKAYRLPHSFGASLEIKFGYATKLLFTQQWDKAWDILATFGKSITDTLRRQNNGLLPEWSPANPSKEVSIIQEGGYGDIIQYSRYLPFVTAGRKVNIYMTPTYYESGYVDFFRSQGFDVEFRDAHAIPATVPAVGFLDFNRVFRAQPDAVLQYQQPWRASSESERKYAWIRSMRRPVIGLCWHAREKENIFAAPGSYRSLTAEQAQRLIHETEDKVCWVNLQHGESTPGTQNVDAKTWHDTAGIVANCDAVVSVDTAVMHLAGAMGKPTHTVLSAMVEWKFSLPEHTGNRCLWYPSMRLHRSFHFGFEDSLSSLIRCIRNDEIFGP
jgi:Glycosyltransferase family 9 (heptosyltransferase)